MIGAASEERVGSSLIAGVKDPDNPEELVNRISEEIQSYDEPILTRVTICGVDDYIEEYSDADTAATEILSKLEDQ